MSQIKLQGYKTVEPNEVFAKREKPIKNPEDNREIEIRSVTLLSSYSSPTQQDVTDYIIKNMAIYSGGSEKQRAKIKKKHPKIEMLPQETIELIAEEDKASIEHLKTHLSNLPHETEGNYVTVCTAVVLASELKFVQQKRKEGIEKIYERLINERGRNFWSAKARLEEDGSFPNNKDLEVLLANEVTSSRTINVVGKYQSYEAVAKQLNIIAKALHSPETIKQIPDLSGEMLHYYMLRTLDELLICQGTHQIMQKIEINLEGVLDSIHKIMSSPQSSNELNSKDSRNPDDSGSYRAMHLN